MKRFGAEDTFTKDDSLLPSALWWPRLPESSARLLFAQRPTTRKSVSHYSPVRVTRHDMQNHSVLRSALRGEGVSRMDRRKVARDPHLDLGVLDLEYWAG